MKYIENLFHFYKTTASFEDHKKLGLINPDSICFLHETGQIYTQNTFFGICKERYETLELLVMAHDTQLKNILGIEGDSVSDNKINNLKDITNFLDGFSDQENLKSLLDYIKESLQLQIEQVNQELTAKLSELQGNIENELDTISLSIQSVNSRLDDFDLSVNTLNSLVEDYNSTKNNYNAFKLYVEEKFTYLSDSINNVKEDLSTIRSSIGQANGIAPLGDNSKVPQEYLPDSLETIEEYNSRADFPFEGHKNTIYVALDTEVSYRWTGSIYIAVVTNVTKETIGLGNVNNTSDEDKPVSIATQSALDTKVDIVEGKSLSTNDFTDEYKTNLDKLGWGTYWY